MAILVHFIHLQIAINDTLMTNRRSYETIPIERAIEMDSKTKPLVINYCF